MLFWEFVFFYTLVYSFVAESVWRYPKSYMLVFSFGKKKNRIYLQENSHWSSFFSAAREGTTIYWKFSSFLCGSLSLILKKHLCFLISDWVIDNDWNIHEKFFLVWASINLDFPFFLIFPSWSITRKSTLENFNL